MAMKKEGTVLHRLRVHQINIVEEVQWIREGQVILICPVEEVGPQDLGKYSNAHKLALIILRESSNFCMFDFLINFHVQVCSASNFLKESLQKLIFFQLHNPLCKFKKFPFPLHFVFFLIQFLVGYGS